VFHSDSIVGMRRRIAPWFRRYWPAGLREVTPAAIDPYLVALVIAVAAMAARASVIFWMPVGYAVVPLVFAVAVAAFAVGFGPSLLTLLITGVGLKLLFIGPRGTLFVPGMENRLILAATWLGAIVVAALFERMRSLTRDLRAQRELLRRLLDVQEREKQHLCNEFHDGLVQYAVGARMLLEGCQTRRNAPIEPSVIDTVIDYLKRGIDDGRRAIRGIRPAILDDCDLSEAVADLVDHFCSGGMEVCCTCDASLGRLPSDLQMAVYRVVQEALSNVRKHSGVMAARVSLIRMAGEMVVEVNDEGRGFEPRARRRQGFGLGGIVERMQLVGGECEVESRPGHGTRIVMRVPLPGASGRRLRISSSAVVTGEPAPAAETLEILAKPG
jgi:signal transduction histidine kinase